MTSKIKTYADLVKEKEEMEALIHIQAAQIRQDIRDIKESLLPVRQAVSVVGRFLTKDKTSPLITGGANILIDLVLKKFVLGRAGLLTRLVVPFLVKNYSSHVLAEKKPSILKKIASFFSKNGTHKN